MGMAPDHVVAAVAGEIDQQERAAGVGCRCFRVELPRLSQHVAVRTFVPADGAQDIVAAVPVDIAEGEAMSASLGTDHDAIRA